MAGLARRTGRDRDPYAVTINVHKLFIQRHDHRHGTEWLSFRMPSEFARFKGVWHNFGYMDKTDRELTFQAQKAAGKVDPHSTCLVSEPILKKVRHNGR